MLKDAYPRQKKGHITKNTYPDKPHVSDINDVSLCGSNDTVFEPISAMGTPDMGHRKIGLSKNHVSVDSRINIGLLDRLTRLC